MVSKLLRHGVIKLLRHRVSKLLRQGVSNFAGKMNGFFNNYIK